MLPLIGRLLGWSSDDTKFIGFLAKPWNGFPVNSAFQVSRLGAPSEVQLLHRGWTKHRTFSGTTDLASYRTGIVCDQLCVYVDGQEVAFDVSKGLEGRSAIVAEGV